MKPRITILTAAGFILMYGVQTTNWTLDIDSVQAPESAPIATPTSASASFEILHRGMILGEEWSEPNFHRESIMRVPKIN